MTKCKTCATHTRTTEPQKHNDKMISNFLIYENAEPILQEYPPAVALKMLLEKHDEFPEHYIDAMATAAEIEITCDEPQFLYSLYVCACVQIRMDLREEQERLTSLSK